MEKGLYVRIALIASSSILTPDCRDYRGLKKRISSIRRQSGNDAVESPTTSAIPENEDDELIPSVRSSTSRVKDSPSERPGQSGATEVSPPVHFDDNNNENRSHRTAERPARPPLKAQASGTSIFSLGKSHTGPRRQRSLLSRRLFSRANPTVHSPRPFAGPLPLNNLYPLLSSEELKFFKALDHELEKVENFYLDREKEMRARTLVIEDQLNELIQHRQRFHAARARRRRWSDLTHDLFAVIKPGLKQNQVQKLDSSLVTESALENEDLTNIGSSSKKTGKNDQSPPSGSHPESGNDRNGKGHTLDPDEYRNAKKKLKKAVLEHYRGLELLHNYRVLNITGFRKALKKFEKVTKIPAQQAYMSEKVETSTFASDKAVRTMMTEMEELYTSRFAHGDKKRAMAALRGTSLRKTHHFSTFRSGVMLGLAIPALVSGIYESFQPETREEIEGWDGLLFAYAILVVPVVFTLLVGLNLLVWSRSRINYAFIFELDTRTRLDYREYFELPSLLFSTLCYAFWLSFYRIGGSSISPTIWPLVWLGLTALVIVDPFGIAFKSSRFWLVKNIFRLLISGIRRVEFADFWMGDQFCSLVFTLSNLYLFACAYANEFEDWRKCGSTSKYWPVAFVLAILPFIARLVQSIRRYVDSKLITHLINGGKYGTGIVYYLMYFIWRHQGGPYNVIFAMWCLVGTIYSVYASAWDFLMDWSLLRPRVHYPLLRSELIYSNHIYMYYVAMITNVLIRFIWVIYIPSMGPDIYLRQFIAAMLEILRRWQWNFYRLENEHLGNMDQYRVTREVPLPYSLDEYTHDGEDEDEGLHED
ncbi:signal transduction protein [Moniliophthora roreri MCA 2997]|uniref:Signal transduction protein n=1 Tax=Moniliophthora roreri (strain MCA 2997) TaxID=1381753 RepID=V2XCH3_MONRO|nr:signal transduction protein [Moniliophthora roreri MCA 2997]